MVPDDTIVAVSSAAGPAARMVVRTSGSLSFEVGRILCEVLPTTGGAARHVHLKFAGLTCPAWVYTFRAPRSYTGEDLVEYHLPGNAVLARLLLDELQSRGLRNAEPGEFTARAYFHGRMDLTAAEGVAATIAAGSEQELAAARRLLAGELAHRLEPAMDLLAGTLALLEVGIDFSDEDVTFLAAEEVRRRIDEVAGELSALLADSARFEQLAHEPTFVLVGRPNAGKSSLLNALAGYERAVASPVAGTTRDALTVTIALPRGQVRVIDVAGLEEDVGVEPVPVDGRARAACGFANEGVHRAPLDPDLDVKQQMRERALRVVAEADFVVLVQPSDEAAAATGGAEDTIAAMGTSRRPDLVVISKCDLAGQHQAGLRREAHARTSVVTGDGLPALLLALDTLAFGRTGSDARLALNLRHVRAIEQAIEALHRAAALAGGAAELCAAELREALDALGQVLGQVSPDELIGRIFSQFCIGK